MLKGFLLQARICTGTSARIEAVGGVGGTELRLRASVLLTGIWKEISSIYQRGFRIPGKKFCHISQTGTTERGFVQWECGPKLWRIMSSFPVSPPHSLIWSASPSSGDRCQLHHGWPADKIRRERAKCQATQTFPHPTVWHFTHFP